jgi:hypothetical protein
MLSYNPFNDNIDATAFRGTKLQLLTLVDTGLTRVPRAVYAVSKTLVHLDLSYNRICTLNNTDFWGLHLKILIMKQNRTHVCLHVIPDALINLKMSLERLDLDVNATYLHGLSHLMASSPSLVDINLYNAVTNPDVPNLAPVMCRDGAPKYYLHLQNVSMSFLFKCSLQYLHNIQTVDMQLSKNVCILPKPYSQYKTLFNNNVNK